MTDDPLDGPEAGAWRRARREAPAPAGFSARVLAATSPASGPTRPRERTAVRRALETTALALGGAYFLARVAGLFLVFFPAS